MFDLALIAPRAIVDGIEAPCEIGVSEGRIAAIEPLGSELPARETVRLAPTETLLPGLVDTHVHINEPGRTEWEGFKSATRAAAAGGVTTIVDMPLNSIPATTALEALEIKRARARAETYVDVGFWGGCVPGNLDELAAMHEAGVLGFKAFLIDSGVPEFQALSAADLLPAITETARLGALLLVHCEDAQTIASAPAPAGASYAAFLRSRPPTGEDVAIRNVIAAAQETGGRAHVVHLSSSSALPDLRAARAAGVDVTVETCPHYLTLEAETIPDGATQFKCCPPIREAENRDRLWDALVDGDIDMIVSDHSPCPTALKRLDTGDFGDAWGGIASLQLGLSLVWTEARTRDRSSGEVAEWMARAPADRVGLSYKGRIAVGADADLVAFDPDATFVVDPAQLFHRHPVTPYAGRELYGVVRRTWLRGIPVDGNGTARGRLLHREEQR
ncbi:MAG: allantoinase AllB [Acidimicrobiales bacterium]